MSHVLYNPKATAPAVYIPAWLSQVPSKLLTPACKMVYGRLAQWATSQGKAHRSAKQLGEELGMPERTVEDCLKQLREKELIGSYVKRDGGHNHFEFYDHPWMHEQINENLCYKSDSTPPPAKSAVPPAKSAVPPAKSAVHKIKEIKGNKRTTTTSKDVGGSSSFSKTKKQMLEYKLDDDPRTDEVFLENCKHHIENNSPNKSDSPHKRTMMLISLLKTLFEVGEHFKSKGYINAEAQKAKAEQEEKKKAEFMEAQDRQHQERIAGYQKSSEKSQESKPSQERRGVPTSIKSLLGMSNAYA